MIDALKKYWPILALGIGVWAIWNFFKPTVYDIKLPENMAESVPFEEVNMTDYGQVLELSDTSVFTGRWDSITASAGIQIEKKNGHISFSRKKNALPLEFIKYWKSGFAYLQTATQHSNFPDDTCCLESANRLFNIGYWDGNRIKPNLFKESFLAEEIIIKMEKPRPKRIVALWQNFEIAGETNGESIKIKIPACAAKFKHSLIRIWACDDTFASPVCSIPLAGLLVAERYSQVATLDRKEEFKRMENIARTVLLPNANSFIKFKKDLEKLYLNDAFKLNMAYGDIRFMNNNEVWLCNYFGKKIIFIFNNSSSIKQYAPSIKGVFKTAASGTKFTQKGNKIYISVPANMYEIIY